MLASLNSLAIGLFGRDDPTVKSTRPHRNLLP